MDAYPRFLLMSSAADPRPSAEDASPPTPQETIPLADLLQQTQPPPATTPVREIGGRRDGPEPTRYGDWEKNGRCIDF